MGDPVAKLARGVVSEVEHPVLLDGGRVGERERPGAAILHRDLLSGELLLGIVGYGAAAVAAPTTMTYVRRIMREAMWIAIGSIVVVALMIPILLHHERIALNQEYWGKACYPCYISPYDR
jgi:hypothetical protein